MEKKNYNGWANRETWNIALWINNDECSYQTMRDIIKRMKRVSSAAAAREISEVALGKVTRDGISLNCKKIKWSEIKDMMNEMIKDMK